MSAYGAESGESFGPEGADYSQLPLIVFKVRGLGPVASSNSFVFNNVYRHLSCFRPFLKNPECNLLVSHAAKQDHLGQHEVEDLPWRNNCFGWNVRWW
jgi:hypothetical protein